MSGPLAQWVVDHHPKLETAARFVLVVLALQAKHDGTDADLTRQQIGERTGLSRSAVDRALKRLRAAPAIWEGPVPGRGRPRQRQIRIWWCLEECFTCALLRRFLVGKVTASDELSGGKVTAAPAKGHRQRHPQRDDRRPSVTDLARYAAQHERRRP